MASDSGAANRGLAVQGGALKQRTASAYNAYFSILKTFCGLGMLSIPFGFRSGGLALGMFLTFFVSVVSNWGARLIIAVKADIENTTAVSCISLQEICRVTLGPVASFLFKFCMVSSQLGVVSGYHSYVTRSIDAFVGGDSKNLGPQYPGIAASLVPLFLFLICFKSLKHVSYLATFAIVIIISTCIGLIAYGLAVVCNGVTSCGDVEYAKFDTSPVLIGILTFSMEGIYVLPSVYDAMRDPRKFGLVLDLSYATATAISAVFGMCAYYIWGPETAAVVATNLPSSPGTTFVGSMLCIVLICSYPLQMFPISAIFDEWVDAAIAAAKGLFRKGGEFEAIEQGEDVPAAHAKKSWSFGQLFEINPKRLVTRILQVAITFSAAVAFPNLGNFISLVGCIGFSLGGYFFPAVCYYKHFKVKLARERAGLILMCVWSVFFVMLPGIIINSNAIMHPTGGNS